MSGRSERRSRLELSLLVEAGDPRLVALLARAEPADIVAAAVAGERLDGEELPEPWLRRADGVRERAAEVAGHARARGLRWVSPGDAGWPAPLADLDVVDPISGATGAPLGLWVRGRGDLATLMDASVAVVGARDATTYGCDVAQDIAGDVADAGVTVVSGAAYGIDASAHRGALAMDAPTVAVLACGVDVDYPRANAGLLARAAEQGAVVSEQAPGQTPTRGRFLTRNRLIAALTRGTVVVEAARRSGALNTINWASELGRVTMGVPGPVTSQSSIGVHQSLRSGQSILVTSGAEVLEAVSGIGEVDATLAWAPSTLLDELPHAARAVLEAVSAQSAEGTDVVAARIACDPAAVQEVLAHLCDQGWVERSDGGWRLRRRADLSPGQSGRTVTR
ncbi:MAG: DNA-processing protein DprA [Mycobacteriales bacterium]